MRGISGFIFPVLAAASIGAAYGAAPDSAAGSINKQALTQAPGEAQPAVWAEKKANFTFQGFTSRYTCDAIEDAIRDVLRQFGARRSDIKLSSTGCSDPGRPSPFPGVNIRMSVLQPAVASSSETVAAHWKTVNLKLNDNFRNTSGQCELVEEVKKQIVPLFTTRNLDSRTHCIPHQVTAGEPTLKVDVIFADVEAPRT